MYKDPTATHVDLDGSDSPFDETLAKSYEYLGVIGTGGMGSVFLARHRILGHYVAIKRMIDERGRVANTGRFVNEAKAASKLKHENVIAVHEFGIDSKGVPYAIMEYVDGESLAQVLKRHGIPSAQRTVDIAMQIAAGLEHARLNGIVHRDIKPSNVIISTDTSGKERATIVDFGIAKIMQQEEGQRLTLTGEVFGSPCYLSPEQAFGSPVDHRSDVYSLGCLMFECLTGAPPFMGDNPVQTATKHITAPIPPINAPQPLPNGLAEVVTKCLCKEPDGRFQTAAELSEALSNVKTGRKRCQRSSLWRNLKRASVGLVVLACVSLLGVGVLFFNSQQPRPPGIPPSGVPVNQLFGNPESLRYVSDYAKMILEKDSGEAYQLYAQGKYSDSAYRLLGSAQALKGEVKRLKELRERSTSKEERSILRSTISDIERLMHENISHAGECFLRAKNYHLALQQFDECIPFFKEYAMRTRTKYGAVAEAYGLYIETLTALGNEASVEQAKKEFALVMKAMGALKKDTTQ